MGGGSVRWCGITLCLAVVTLAAACGSSSHAGTTTSPRDAQLVRAVTPILERLGLKLQRASFERRGDPGRTLELNVYAEPAHSESADVYASRLAPLASAVVPAMLREFPDADWVDVCQEHANTPGDVPEPLPVTRLEISRAVSEKIDWPTAKLATLLARNRASSAEVDLEVHDGVSETPTWKAAAAESRTLGG